MKSKSTKAVSKKQAPLITDSEKIKSIIAAYDQHEEHMEKAIEIEAPLKLAKIELKDLEWLVKLKVKTLLPRAYQRYELSLVYNRASKVERIKELHSSLVGTLFEMDPKEWKRRDKQILDIVRDMEDEEAMCETMKFSARIVKLEYKSSDTTEVVIRVPDDIIDSLNRQKTRLDKYKVVLNPDFNK